jgi:Tat protein translocase TatB subunit
MFDLGIQEIIVIFIVALIALGPERLPEAGRKLGKLIGGFKSALYDVKSQINAEMHADFNPLQGGLDGFKKDVLDEVKNLDRAAKIEAAKTEAPKIEAAERPALRPVDANPDTPDKNGGVGD